MGGLRAQPFRFGWLMDELSKRKWGSELPARKQSIGQRIDNGVLDIRIRSRREAGEE